MKVQYKIGDIIQYVDIGRELEIIKEDDGYKFESNTCVHLELKVNDKILMNIFVKNNIRSLTYFNDGNHSGITENIYEINNYSYGFIINVTNGKLMTVLSPVSENVKHIKLIEID